MQYLKTGDLCPCCGQPILTEDPARLRTLTWIAEWAAVREVAKNREAKNNEA